MYMILVVMFKLNDIVIMKIYCEYHMFTGLFPLLGNWQHISNYTHI